MSRSDRILKKWYRRYNQDYFHNLLPDDVIVRYGTYDEWEEESIRLIADTDIATRPIEIRISPYLKLLNWGGIARFTLLHEMVHVKAEVLGIELEDDHGDWFEQEMTRLAMLGAFRKHKGQSCLW